jgi:hypothetical protein
MKPPYRSGVLGAALLALSACGGDSREADTRTAVGEVLPGSVSDKMIHYDQLRSQPPLAPRTGSGGASGQNDDNAAGEVASEAAEADSASTAEAEPASPAEAPAE